MDKGIHFLQITDDRPLPVYRQRCMASVKAIIRPEVDTYEVCSTQWNSDPLERVKASEMIRFEKAKTVSNLCYIDTDCFIHRAFYPDGNGPFFGEYSFGYTEPNIPDIFYFFVNDCTDYFRRNFGKLIMQKGRYSIDMDILKSLTNFNLIPKDTYLHSYSTMGSIVEIDRINRNSVNDLDMLEYSILKKTSEQMFLTISAFNEMRKKNG